MNSSRISRIFLAAVACVFAAGTTHIVVKGDTLWDITGKYLGNPFQWPSVWQKNPQIRDAHWIYPGDSVLVEGTANGSVSSYDAAASQGGAAAKSDDPLAEFSVNPLNQVVVSVDTTGGSLQLIVPPTQSMLNLEMVIDAPVLYPPDEAAPSFQTAIIYDKDYGRQLLMPGSMVQGKLGSDDGVKVGDRLAIVERDDNVATNVLPGTKGRLEETRALADVIEVHPKYMICRLVSVFGVVGTTAKLRRFESPSATSVTAFENVQDPNPANVVVNNRLGRIQLPGTAVIVDRGEADGIGQGDIFEFMDAASDRGLIAMRGYGLVVRTTRSTATIQIVGVTPKSINVGDKAWRVRRSVRG